MKNIELIKFIENRIWLYKNRLEDLENGLDVPQSINIYRTIIGELEEELKLEIKKSP